VCEEEASPPKRWEARRRRGEIKRSSPWLVGKNQGLDEGVKGDGDAQMAERAKRGTRPGTIPRGSFTTEERQVERFANAKGKCSERGGYKRNVNLPWRKLSRGKLRSCQASDERKTKDRVKGVQGLSKRHKPGSGDCGETAQSSLRDHGR